MTIGPTLLPSHTPPFLSSKRSQVTTVDHLNPDVRTEPQNLDSDRSLREVPLPNRLLLFQPLPVESIHQGNWGAGKQGEKSLSSFKATLVLFGVVRRGAVAIEKVHQNLES